VLAADIADDRLAHIDSVTSPAVQPIDVRGDDVAARLREATPNGDGPTVVVDTVGNTDTLVDAWEALSRWAGN